MTIEMNPGGAATWQEAVARQLEGLSEGVSLQVRYGRLLGMPSQFPPAPHQHSLADVSGLLSALEQKQPLASVLTNTTAPFTTEQASKLAGIEAGAQVNPDFATINGQSITQGGNIVIEGGSGGSVSWADVQDKPAFATVAISGAYSDLSGRPGPFAGSTPGLVPSPGAGGSDRFLRADGVFVEPPGAGGGGSVAWTDVTSKPGWTATFDGSYSSLSGLPELFDGQWSSLADVPQAFPPETHTHPSVTTQEAGFMLPADKAKLDSLDPGAIAGVRAVLQTGESLPDRPDANDWPPVQWYSWTDPTGESGPMLQYDQWIEIPVPPAPEVPLVFTAGQWSINASGAVTITALPSSDPAITDIEYRVDGGSAISFGESTAGTYATTATEGQDVQIRAVNAEGAGAWSDTKVVPAADAPPAQFTTEQWSVSDSGTGGSIVVTVSALPAAQPAVSGVEYRIDGGAWSAFAPELTGSGTRTISGLSNGQAVDINLRAINSVGPANDPGSDTKEVTPTETSSLTVEWIDEGPDAYGGLSHLAQDSNGTGAVSEDDDPIGWAENIAGE